MGTWTRVVARSGFTVKQLRLSKIIQGAELSNLLTILLINKYKTKSKSFQDMRLMGMRLKYWTS